ncbi:MAG: hypothetical protein EU535_07775 [Promethearchaeota archaeon]|nr:MAG: hypothetical protein EU535_07775 [Candidatus Lokiarchaeota archaeon]
MLISKSVIEIAKFLRDLAQEYGTIQIYGFNLRKEGYGSRHDSALPFHPIQDPSKVDPNMPIAGTEKNNRFFELRQDRLSDFDDPDKGFIKFLGALFADGQTFVVRFGSEETGWLPNNQILFAFRLLGGEIMPQDLKPLTLTYPSRTNLFHTPQGLDSAWNEVKYNEIQTKWLEIIRLLKEKGMLSYCKAKAISTFVSAYSESDTPSFSELTN